MSSEPKQTLNSDATTPLWLIVLFSVLAYGGLLYFDAHGGGFDPQVYAPYHSLQQVEALQPVKGELKLFDVGRLVYNKPTCVACHQASGAGTPGQFPTLRGTDWVMEPEPGRMIRIVLHGLQGPMEVQGQQYNSAMVPWKDVLSDDEIAAVLTYVRQNKEWGNTAPEVKPARVKEVREKEKERTQPWTAEELLKLSPAD